MAFAAFGVQDGLQLGEGFVEISVDDGVVVVFGVRDFFRGFLQAQGERRGIVAAALDEAFLQRLARGRQQKNADDRGGFHLSFDLFCALPIDIEQHILTALQSFTDGVVWRCVEVAEDFRPFEKVSAVAAFVEGLAIEEVVVFAFDLVWALRSGCARDGHDERGRHIVFLRLSFGCEQFSCERGLSCP